MRQYALIAAEVGASGELEFDESDIRMLGDGVDMSGVGDAIEGARRRRIRPHHRSNDSMQHHKRKVRARSGIFGLDSTDVLASGDGSLQQRIQEPVFFQRLTFDGDTTYFKCTDIKIGAKSQMSGTAPFPTGAFRPDATNAGFSINKRGRVGQDVTVLVTNIDAANTRSISAMIKTLEHYRN